MAGTSVGLETVTFARNRDDNDEARFGGRSATGVLLSAPPLNAANDNDRSLQLLAIPECSDSVTSVQSQARSPFGTVVLIIACLATVLLMAAGWVYIVSMTLLDSVKWVLS
jgi:hypothetical protein